MTKFSFFGVLITFLLITTNLNNVKCRRMPIRMLRQRFEEHQAEVPAYGIGRQATGAKSESQSSALTNAVDIAGLPIMNSVSGTHSASTSSGHSANFQEHFGLGGYGFDLDLDSDKIGTGISANRVPGQQLGLHIGGLNLGLTKKSDILGSQNAQTETGATAAATGHGAQSSSQSKTQSNSITGFGGLINVQNTLSKSQSTAYSQDGTASANSGANSLAAAQTAAIRNAVTTPLKSSYQQPGIGGIFNSFPSRNFYGPFGFSSIQPMQHYPQQQFGHHLYPGQQFLNQQGYNFPSQHYPIQYHPGQQYPIQQYPFQQFPNHQGYNVYGQQISPSQGNYGPRNPPFNTLSLNYLNNQQPTIHPSNSPNQGLVSTFSGQGNAAFTPVQPSHNGPVLAQGGLQNTYTPQQNVPQSNIVENIIPTTQNYADNSEPGAEFDLDVRIKEDDVKSKNETNSNRVKRSETSEDAVSFPKDERASSVTASENKPTAAVNETKAANGTELESRFGGPLGGIVRQVIGGLLGGQNQGLFNQPGYQPQQGGFYNQGPGLYPQQGGFYNQGPGFYPPQGNYYNQGPGYYPQQQYPIGPGFGGPRFRRAAEGDLVFPNDDDEEKKNSIVPETIQPTKTAEIAAINETTVNDAESEKNSTDLESRFGLFGRRPLGGGHRLFGLPTPPFFGRPHNGYEKQHNHHRPDYPSHHHHRHNEGPHYVSHNQPAAYPLQPTIASNLPHNIPPYQQPQFNQQPQYNQQTGINNQQTNSNGAAQSQNQNALSNQNSASNTYSSNMNNAQGNFQNTGGSGVSSNIANNGQSGQVSSSNTEQQNYQTANGWGNKSNGQSQAANFDQHGNLGTSSANTGTQHIFGPDGERNQANGAANAHQQTQHGVSDSSSQSNAETINQNGLVGNKATGQSLSAFQGADGSISTANSGSETQVFENPNGIKGTLSSSHSSSQNIGNGLGGNVATSSSSGSGTGFGGSQTYSNAGGFNNSPYGGSGAQTNSFSGSNNFGSNAGSNAASNSHNNNRPIQSTPFIFS